MRVLLTGASSFTGFWFAKSLLEAEIQVIAPLRGPPQSYEGVRAERVQFLSRWTETIPNCAFGEPAFLQLIERLHIDVLCHHAAEARDYRSPDFDPLGATASNTRNFRQVLLSMRERGLKAVVATGSVFEPDEGAGPNPRRAFSPYGLSKGLTWSVIRHWCEALAVPLAKFVIANPFGPLEDPRFVTYVVERWAKGEAAEVRTPAYLRDNIHVDLLARAYARYVRQAGEGRAAAKFGPCGYVETQGAFAERLQRELAPRLGLKGRLTLKAQTEFPEPLARVNTDAIDPAAYEWSDEGAWDNLADFWRARGVAAAGAAPPPRVETLGAVDVADNLSVSGWLTAKTGANPRYARVIVDEVERGVVRADGLREDLAARQISDGYSGFRFRFAAPLDPYVEHVVRCEDRDAEQPFGPPSLRVPKLVGGANSPFICDGDFLATSVGWANYEPDRAVILVELLGAAAKFGPPVSRNASLEIAERRPLEDPYFQALGVDVLRILLFARAFDHDRPIDINFPEAETLSPVDQLLCRSAAPARLPDYMSLFAQEHMERVSGPGEQMSRFAACGLATADRIDQLTRLYFGKSLAGCGRVLDWGAGPGRVALPLARVLSPGIDLTAADVDAFNVAFGRERIPDIAFVDAPFLPPLPYPDAHFGAIYGVSVFTHLNESVQFAWLQELRRLVPAGAPVIVSVHSEFALFRTARGQPEILAEAMRRGISDYVADGNLGPKLADQSYYRATFHTRAYVLKTWSRHFDVLDVLTAANINAQDFVVLRAK